MTNSSGSRETLEWTVADAKRNIIRLKGGRNLFHGGTLLRRIGRLAHDKAVEIACRHAGFAVDRPAMSRIVREIRIFLSEVEAKAAA